MSGLVKLKKTISYMLILVTLLLSALCTSNMSYVFGADTTETQFASGAATEKPESTAASYSNKNSVVAISKFYLRKSAVKSSDKVKLITKDTVLYVTKNCTGNWVQVKDSAGTAGYAPNKELNYVAGTSAIIKCKTTDVVNLRKGKGTTYEVITTIPKATTLTVKANNNAIWIKVTYKSNTGFISKEYAKTIVEIPSSEHPKTVDDDTESFPISLKYTSATIYKDCYFHINATNNTKETIKWSSSNKSVATVTQNGIVYGKETGTATIKAKISTKTVSCTIKVINKSVSVNISNKTYSANRAKTIYLTSTTKGVSWSSSDTSVATVKDGLVLCKKKGKAVIRAKVSGGWATCLVTVKGREAVRFTYANPNSAPLNSKVTFIAITDKIRTDVKFKVSSGSNDYTVKASSKTLDGDTYVWKGTKKLTNSGAYKIVAYSKYGDSWKKSTGSYGSVFVSNVEDNTTVSCEERHASNKIISFISNYEGFLSQAMYDPLTNFPCLTVGYGRVIYAGETFYNNMTKNEAFAYLVDSVESDGYVSKVNRF
ncbi:MAG: SH3 domain-containing protein, partial [Oscillospiraceae bacterium]|nr:SH3 domain-containing protein [Oscillospiraceae bacterium]